MKLPSTTSKNAPRRWSRAFLFFVPLAPALMVLLGTEFLVTVGWVKGFLVPAPSTVAVCLWQDRAELFSAFVSTAVAASAGLFLSFIVGSAVAILLSTSSLLRRAIYPYATFFQTVPIVAIAPLLVIWFGFGQSTVIASAFIVSVFPVIASTLLGLESTDRALIELFQLYSGTRFQILARLRLPFALPEIFSGLRIASGLAVIGAIVGEFIAGGGIGEIVDAARTQQRIDKVFAAVLISSLLGLLMVGFINFVSHLMLRNWHASAQERA
jgi:NitT/TauT family transport system permease protein